MPALVEVRNVGDVDFVDSFERKQYRIPAGSKAIVDAEVACLWLGYPGLRDEPTRGIFTRTDQHYRLRARFGWHAGLMEEDRWEALRPKLEVYTLEGERVWMILDDPTGENTRRSPLVEQEIQAASELDLLRERMEQQERELEAMRNLIQGKVAEQETGEGGDEAEEDKPRQVPVGARSRGKSKG